MKLLILIFLSCAVATFAVPRIIGGHDAPDGKYPYIVSLRTVPFWHLCAGSILNKRWILTAGHCIKRSLIVVAGTNLIDGGEEQVYHSEYTVTHESWHNPRFSNDIGLIRVSKDIEFNDKVQPIPLPKEDFNKAVGYPATMIGWGSLKLGGNTSQKLQEIALKMADQQVCKEALQSIANISQAHICTFTKYGEGFCHGDSGSPLVVDGVQVGIASFMKPCAVGVPDAYVRVYTYLDWITAQQAKF